MRSVLSLSVCLTLVACGGSRSVPASAGFATGPIYSACLAADRRAASRELCGCVQFVADQRLSPRDQSRAAGFFSDPQSAQDTRQSDNPFSEAFWDRYRAYADVAERACRAG